MKVIDLLNKIANGEEVPEKFKYEDMTYIYRYDLREHFDEEENNSFNYTFDLTDYNVLNDEVEIIEDTPKEDKKIKRIQSCGDNLYSEYIGQWLVHKENYSEYDELLMNKINEIIDRLNGE